MKSFNIGQQLLENGGRDLADALRKRAVPKEQIERLVESGYYLFDMKFLGSDESTPCVMDSFYGQKWLCGCTPIDEFISSSLGPTPLHVYRDVSSLVEIERILSDERHAIFRRSGRMSFRGQVQEHYAYRSYPNPTKCQDGAERLIIPSFWRHFRTDWMKRFEASVPRSIFGTMYADPLFYHGIPDWTTLQERNLKRYGPHTMSDLVDFPDPESREYGRRWREKVFCQFGVHFPLIEQHYGIETCGLDVTFDVSVAAFFAANKFVCREDKTAHYVPLHRGDHRGVIYGLVFTHPPLKRDEELIREIPVFSHIPPVRPIRQQCAMPFFHAENINEAVCDLDFVMYLAPDFETEGLPDQRELFPLASEDPFYEATLEVKRRVGVDTPYDKFVEYRFE